MSCACAVVYGLGFNMAEALSAGNVLHAVVTFIFFHWAKGSPDTHAQGDYDDLTAAGGVLGARRGVTSRVDDASGSRSSARVEA